MRDETSPLVLPLPAEWVEDESDEPQPVSDLSIRDLDEAEDTTRSRR
ncbi:hypothetical protein ACFXCZ_34005 [Streptomyces sp. NPDC059396]